MRMKTETRTDCIGSTAQRMKGWMELAGIQSRMGEQSYRTCRKLVYKDTMRCNGDACNKAIRFQQTGHQPSVYSAKYIPNLQIVTFYTTLFFSIVKCFLH